MNLNMDFYPRLRIVFDSKANKKECEDQEVDVTGFIGVKGFKAKGKRLSNYYIKRVEFIDPEQPDPDYEQLQHDKEVEEKIAKGEDPDVLPENEDADPNEQLSLF